MSSPIYEALQELHRVTARVEARFQTECELIDLRAEQEKSDNYRRMQAELSPVRAEIMFLENALARDACLTAPAIIISDAALEALTKT